MKRPNAYKNRETFYKASLYKKKKERGLAFFYATGLGSEAPSVGGTVEEASAEGVFAGASDVLVRITM
jgi:hypothetical protein